MGDMACTGPLCLYSGTLYLYLYLMVNGVIYIEFVSERKIVNIRFYVWVLENLLE
jgi:hypothetical protein